MIAEGKDSFPKSVTAKWKRHDVTRTLSLAVRLPLTIAQQPSNLAILLLSLVFMGIVNITLSSLGSVFQSQYHFSPTTAGCSYLGLGIGGIVGLATTPRFSNLFAKTLQTAKCGESKRPKHVLPMMIVASPFVSAGLLWYGWSTQRQTHWIVPILGLCVFGIGYTSIRVCLLLAGSDHDTADINSFVRKCSSSIPLQTIQHLHSLRIPSSTPSAALSFQSARSRYTTMSDNGWGNSVLALINLALWIVPVAMYILSSRSEEGTNESANADEARG